MNGVKRIDMFWKRWDFLSNFYSAYVSLDGICYLSSEAAYQAYKCADEKERAEFASLPANKAKRLGSRIAVRDDWDKIKLEVMERVVRAKFTQNPYLAKYLINTGDAELVEGNDWNDTFWGVNLETGEGQNNLGKILMNLRSEFSEKGISEQEEANEILAERFENGISVRLCDICRVGCDCIVNEADETLLDGGGVFYAIHREAGEELMAECRTLGGCGIAEAKMTCGYALPAKRVIHTALPQCIGAEDKALLELTYKNVLDLAEKSGIHSIAFPALGCWKNGFSKEDGTRIAAEAVLNRKGEHENYDIEVIFACAHPYVYKYFLKELKGEV